VGYLHKRKREYKDENSARNLSYIDRMERNAREKQKDSTNIGNFAEKEALLSCEGKGVSEGQREGD